MRRSTFGDYDYSENCRLSFDELRSLVPALKEAGRNRLIHDITKEDDER